jgi:hypothetical protein
MAAVCTVGLVTEKEREQEHFTYTKDNIAMIMITGHEI